MVEIDEKQGFSIIQKAKETGTVKIGINEVTKAIERGEAKMVLVANDISPAEIVAHIPGLCKEMNILFNEIGNKTELGTSVGIKTTTAVAIIDGGNAKKEIEALINEAKEEKAKASKPAAKEEKKVEEKKTEAKVEKKVEEEKTEAKVEEKVEEKAE